MSFNISIPVPIAFRPSASIIIGQERFLRSALRIESVSSLFPIPQPIETAVAFSQRERISFSFVCDIVPIVVSFNGRYVHSYMFPERLSHTVRAEARVTSPAPVLSADIVESAAAPGIRFEPAMFTSLP